MIFTNCVIVYLIRVWSNGNKKNRVEKSSLIFLHIIIYLGFEATWISDGVGIIKIRNNERRNGDAKRSFKHAIPIANGALQFPILILIFWFVLYLDKMNIIEI